MDKHYRIGDIIEGNVTGIQTYGVFVSLDAHTQGLVHISECKHGYMDNLKEFVSVGDTVVAKVIDIDEYTNKISLSIRALEPVESCGQEGYRKRAKKRYTPSIGFASLAQILPKWIDEAKHVFVEERKK